MKLHSAVLAAFAVAPVLAAQTPDPRITLTGGLNAQQATKNLRLTGHAMKAPGFFKMDSIGDIAYWNSDLAFRGNLMFQGGWHGIQIWDVSNRAMPKIRSTIVCPGGQGDPSVWGNLLFMSVEARDARIDCGTQGIKDTVSAERFDGVRIFDISDLDHPKQVATVQTCRGSHTHTLVNDPKDKDNVYVYVSGTSSPRSPMELAGCSGGMPDTNSSTALFRIDIIKVPLARPQDAAVVNSPRIFADTAGHMAGLAKSGSLGPGAQEGSETNRCHDITVYPEMRIAAGACAGNGIILDISDVVHPKRIDEVADPNFSFWHSATFSNDAKTVLFTDEWGGGTHARCRATDRPEWGADAIFDRSKGKMRFEGYYKLPVAQSENQNCVAHNGSLIPVPGRNIMAQGWYQGGLSVVDFTDPHMPVEIAYFDRGPLTDSLVTSGVWGGYWYNGQIFGSEMGRGLDIWDLMPSEYLSKNEIDAAKLVKLDMLNPQMQPHIVWPAAFVVARAYMDQLRRGDALRSAWAAPVSRQIDAAEKLSGAARKAALNKLATQLDKDAVGSSDSAKVRALASVLREIK